MNEETSTPPEETQPTESSEQDSQPPDPETDEWGNPLGTLYDEDGNAYAPDDEGEEVVTQRETPAEPEAQPTAAARPAFNPAPLAPAFSEAELESLQTLWDENPVAAQIQISQRLIRHEAMSMASANAHVANVLGATPEFITRKGPAIQQALASLQPEQRATENGIKTAVHMAMLNEVAAGADMATTFEEYAALLKGSKNSSAAAPPQKGTPAGAKGNARPVLPPQQRSPVTAGAPTKRAVRPSDNPMDALKGDFPGLSAADMRRLRTEL